MRDEEPDQATASEKDGVEEVPKGTCEECEARPALWACGECEGDFCQICYHQLHRKGKRAKHRPAEMVPAAATAAAAAAPNGDARSAGASGGITSWLRGSSSSSSAAASSSPSGSGAAAANAAAAVGGATGVHDRFSFAERAKYIPLRLSMDERLYLRLLEAGLNVSDYTAAVDGPVLKPAARFHAQLGQITSLLGGLVMAVDYDEGQTALAERDFTSAKDFLRDTFEIGRRHKIMNPEKMRGSYGKLIYLMQDAMSPQVQKELGFSVKRGIKSVYLLLKEKEGLAMLSDPLAETATREILALPGQTRAAIQIAIRNKERAVEKLKRKYTSSRLSEEDIHLCLYSVCDNDSFLNSNRLPIDKTIDLLKRYFRPDRYDAGYNLGIVAGQDGARLTHSHERQYHFALQSLTLWREIVHDMFRLWCLAEEDLLSEREPCRLTDTGQGRHRVQQSPRVFKAMQEVLFHCQREVKVWIGSSVVHLGDHNVPNALVFIDKYTQVSRILLPIVTTVEQLAVLCEKDVGVRSLIDCGYGGEEKLTKDILYDFFRSAFDGSGADNFFDAGSCIDGRLTSAWHWCSNLSTKPFYPIFKLTGFTGFDGDFQK